MDRLYNSVEGGVVDQAIYAHLDGGDTRLETHHTSLLVSFTVRKRMFCNITILE
jgi:energy-converting hydrogenase Eha subunit F